jgi:PKD domain
LPRRSLTRLLAVVLVGAFTLAIAPAALAQTTPGSTFEHDDSRDGTENEVIGNFFQAVPPEGDTPEEQRNAIVRFLEANDTDNDFTPPDPNEPWGWETHEFTVAEDEVNGSFTVSIRWGNADVDLDLYVYRREDDGSYTLVASSAAGGTTEENATYAPAPPPDRGDPNSTEPPQPPTEPGVVEPGTYVAYVDNWCSDDDDPLDQELAEDYGADFCDQGGYTDEDDWIGEISFTAPSASNQLPQNVTISGPDSAATGENVTFTASAEDPDGTIERYAFDLDGDGRFEYDGAQFASVSKRYDTPGTYNVGVRVMDDRGGFGFANRRITITGPSLAPAGLAANVTSKPQAVEPLQSFKLSGPQFGGSRNRSLVVRFRLREAGSVTAVLYRGNRRIRRLRRGDVVADRTYRMRVRARGLRRGLYTVRLTVVTASGETQRARLSSDRL